MASRLTFKTSDFSPHLRLDEIFTLLQTVFGSFVSVVSRGYNYRSFTNSSLVNSLGASNWMLLTISLFPVRITRFRNVSFITLFLYQNDHSPFQQQILNKAAQ